VSVWSFYVAVAAAGGGGGEVVVVVGVFVATHFVSVGG